MMNSTTRLAIALTLVATSGLIVGTACGDDESGTQEEEVCERPQEAEEIVDDDIIELLEEEADIPFHCGDSPPEIEGTYEFFDREAGATNSENWPRTGNFCDRITTYESTESPHRYEMISESPGCNTSSEGQDTYITGEGDCFTLFEDRSSVFEGCERTRMGLTSACIAENGDWEEVMTAGYTIHAEDSDECDDVISDGRITAEGEYSVLVPSDGVAPKVD